MSTNAMVPPVTLKGARVPIERLAGYSPHRASTAPEYGSRADTPAVQEAVAVLARRSRAALRRARPFERPIVPA